ncbi:MAG: hypothetical protein COA42_15635, partial [Alteromonadaceae bacterium]
MKNGKIRTVADIAIIGMAGRFPGADNYREFWQNLVDGRSSIREIPQERWDWREVYGDPAQAGNKTNIKWGGFIHDVDKFDPLFFNISPQEANYTDPQHRLFLQSVWHAIEDAGYRSCDLAGKQIGVYAGVSKNDYAELMRENSETIISFVSTGTVHSILANRVSYLLDLRGKSEVVDTACSSFLVALNNAVRDLRSDQCEAAIVGAVNTMLTPTMFISHSKSGMLSQDGKCKTFDADANGYVRGEGVGVVLLKPLCDAQQDNDQVIGIIKGCAVAHGGRSNALTSPKVSSQAAVITAALNDADVDASTIGYVEAHGTATPLGDPVEINGLKAAYLADNDSPSSDINSEQATHCGLSSVKTNIGHLECAAGVAGLIKVLLSFKHKKIPSLLHYKKLNPYIELSGSPFFIVSETHDWQRLTQDDQEIPLRAGLSSFGMGGVNAHVILEEPPARSEQSLAAPEANRLILLSAKKGRLQAQAQQLLDFLKQDSDDIPPIDDIAYTLMFGRDEREQRLAFVCQTLSQISEILSAYLDQTASGLDTLGLDEREPVNYYQGLAAKNKSRKPLTVSESPESDSGKLTELAQHWVEGQAIPWLQDDVKGQRCSLPTYPFEKRSCWFKSLKRPEASTLPIPTEPSAESNIWIAEIAVSDKIIASHTVQNNNMLPGVGYLQLIREKVIYGADISASKAASAWQICDTYWLTPLLSKGQSQTLTIKGRSNLEISSASGSHCRACVPEQPTPPAKLTLDIAGLKQACINSLTQSELYPLFLAHGLDYGPEFQVIQTLSWTEHEALAEIDTSAGFEVGILDGVFQTAAALSIKSERANVQQYVPYFLGDVRGEGSLSAIKYVYVKQAPKSDNNAAICQFDMQACDANGQVIVHFKDFSKRALKPSDSLENMLYYRSQWRQQPGLKAADSAIHGLLTVNTDEATEQRLSDLNPLLRLTLNDTDPQSAAQCKDALGSFKASIKASNDKALSDNKKTALSHVIVQALKPGPSDLSVLLLLIQSLIKAKIKQPIKILYLAEASSEEVWPSIYAAGGLARTLKFENANIHLEVIGLDTLAGADLNDEILSQPAPLHEVQYRDGQRWIREMQPLRFNNEAQDLAIPIKHGGTYVLAGGAGGLGRIFAIHLAQHYQARLILLGRRPLDKTIQTLLDQLQILGAKAEYLTVDICQADQVKSVFTQIRQMHGQLQGIVQASGLIDDNFILKSSVSSFQKVLAPKYSGTRHLDEVSAEDKLDFFIMFSSVAALMPNQGQCAYAAGNSYMDAYADYRSQQVAAQKRSGMSLAINWPLWAQGGMGVSKEEQAHLLNEFGMEPLVTNKGLALFKYLLAQRQLPIHQNSGHWVAMEGDAQKIKRHFNIQRPQVSLPDEALIDYLQQDLKILLAQAEEMPLEDIACDEPFGALGLDSVGFVTMTNGINEALDTAVKPTLFFECETLTQLSQYLCRHQRDKVLARYATCPELAPRYSSMGLLDVEKSDRAKGTYQRQYNNREFYMVDHVVQGQYNVPGACYIEMARQAAVLDRPTQVVTQLSNNYWAKQLSSHGEPFTAFTQLTRRDNASAYEIYSLGDEGQKVVHASGEVHYHQADKAPVFGKLDLGAIRQRCHLSRSREEVYQQIHAEGLIVGPSFMPMQSIVMNEHEALACLALPEAITDTREDYLLHPTLLTGV